MNMHALRLSSLSVRNVRFFSEFGNVRRGRTFSIQNIRFRSQRLETLTKGAIICLVLLITQFLRIIDNQWLITSRNIIFQCI